MQHSVSQEKKTCKDLEEMMSKTTLIVHVLTSEVYSSALFYNSMRSSAELFTPCLHTCHVTLISCGCVEFSFPVIGHTVGTV